MGDLQLTHRKIGRMKKHFSLLLCAVMALAMIVPASPTAGAVTADGRKAPAGGAKNLYS